MRIEAFAYALRQRGKRRRLRREHIDLGAHGGRRANEGSVTANCRDGGVHHRRLRIIAARQSRPDEPAGPIVEELGAGFIGERAANLRAVGWRGRYTPNIGGAPSTLRRKRRHVADRAPQRSRGGFLTARERAGRGEQSFEERFALRYRRRHAL